MSNDCYGILFSVWHIYAFGFAVFGGDFHSWWLSMTNKHNILDVLCTDFAHNPGLAIKHRRPTDFIAVFAHSSTKTVRESVSYGCCTNRQRTFQ